MKSAQFQHITILTGAGISAESGIQTFRDAGGLWEKYPIEEVATPEAYAKNPAFVLDFYNRRRAQLKDHQIAPNTAHQALARLQQEYPGEVTLITQNVDNLHERAGSVAIHMHGELTKMRCTSCEQIHSIATDFDLTSVCQHCHTSGKLRPHIVWFGEIPFHLDRIEAALRDSDLFLSIGTSGQVYPAAMFVQNAKYSGGCYAIEMNLEKTSQATFFDDHHIGPAGELVPKLVDQLLTGEFAPGQV